MKAKVIHTEVSKDGIIHVVDHDLPPGEVDLIILLGNSDHPQSAHMLDAKHIPFGGYKAGWLDPEQLRREAIYEDE